MSRDRNIVQFYGACVQENNLLLVAEMMEVRTCRCHHPNVPMNCRLDEHESHCNAVAGTSPCSVCDLCFTRSQPSSPARELGCLLRLFVRIIASKVACGDRAAT